MPRYDVFKVYYKQNDPKSLELDSLQVLLHFQKDQGQDRLVRKEGQGSFIIPLLEMAASTVTDEQHHLNFSYFQMHYRCWDLHLKLQTDLRQDLTAVGRLIKENLLQQNQIVLRRVPATILQMSGIAGETRQQPTGLVVRSYGVVNAFVKECGSQGVEAVRRAEEEPEVESVDEDSDDVEEIPRGITQPKQQYKPTGGAPATRLNGSRRPRPSYADDFSDDMMKTTTTRNSTCSCPS